MQSIGYKGYKIQAAPYQLAESKEWTINIYIFIDKGSEIVERNYSAGNTFQTEEEAITHCLDFGRQIIDGQIPGCYVNDL